MSVPVSQRMIDVGYKMLCQKEPMVSSFINEEEASVILAAIFKAMFVAGGYDTWRPPTAKPAKDTPTGK